MRKGLKPIILAAILAVTMFTACNGSQTGGDDVVPTENSETETTGSQVQAKEQYKNLLEGLSIVDENGVQIYDDNFGGAYVNDKDFLVVLLLETDDAALNKVKQYIGSSNWKVQKCQHSYNERMAVMDALNRKIIELAEKEIRITGIYDDVQNDRVKIGVYEFNEEKELQIREIIDSDCMGFYDGKFGVFE